MTTSLLDLIEHNRLHAINRDQTLRHELGGWLGTGSSRQVYGSRTRPDIVIKIGYGPAGVQHNMHEYLLWDMFFNHIEEAYRFLAPCLEISWCGSILIQKRTAPVSTDQFTSLRDKMPDWWWDIGVNNVGILDGYLVMHDYAACDFADCQKDIVKCSPVIRLPGLVH
jgi:hypothetical protein